MSRAYRPNPNHPAVDYLVKLHADLGGKIDANKREARRLAEAIKHVEAVIRLFDPDYDVRHIPMRRRNRENPLYKHGQMFRAVLDVLKAAKTPITTQVIVERMFAAKGIKPGIKDTLLLEAGVRSCLSRLKEHVERENVTPARWRVTVADT